MPSFRVGAKRDLPVNTERAWDGAAAKQRIWTWAGWDGNTAPDGGGGKTRQAFLVYDGDAADTKGAYHLPFADVVDGSLTALASGLRAAASRLPQMDGLSDEVRDRARGVLDGYFARLEERQPAPPAGLVPSLGYRVAPAFTRALPTDTALLEKIRSQAILPDAVDLAAFLIVESTISTGEPDSYETVMDETTLRNYAAEAAEGVSVLYGHDTWAIVGRSFSGLYLPRGSGRCVSQCYVPGGSSLGGIATDDVIRAVGLGMLREVSVGFTRPEEYRCTVCERSIWDLDCPHVPGVAYDVPGKRKPVICRVRIIGAHLAEYSFVYAGSTPDATVLSAKALQMADAGRLEPEAARALETSYRVRLPGSHHAWPVFKRDPSSEDDDDEPAEEEESVTKPTTPGTPPGPQGSREAPSPEPQALEESVRTLLSTVVEGEIPEVLTALTATTTELARLRPLGEELDALRVQVAADAAMLAYGRACFERDVEQALAEGQRAHGEKFEREKWERTLRAMDAEAIRLLTENWTAAGDALFKGGRQTTDGPAANGRVGTPISPAFAAGFRA